MNPKISIILPVYNTEKYIQRCLDSIKSQTFENYEVVVVNDATPDGAMSIVEKYAKQDVRYVIVDKKQNEGSMCARKSGYAIARGEYIMFCDTDDYLPANAIEVLLGAIENAQADIVVSGYIYVPVEGKEYSRIYCLPYGNDRLAVYKALLKHDLAHNLWGNLYKRDLFVNYSYPCFLHQTNGEDMILFYELIDHVTKVVAADVPLYYYCQNAGSATQCRYSKDKLEKVLFAGNFWLQRMFDRKVFPDLVTKNGLLMLYDKLKNDYNIDVVLNGYSSLNECLSLFNVQKYLGVVRGFDLWLLLRSRLYSRFRFKLKCKL